MPDDAEKIIYQSHPAMFRAHPFWFIGCIILIAVFGLGILILLYWYILTRATALTLTENDIIYEKGILSKDRTAVSLRHIRAVRVIQGFVNRIMGVGKIEISTAGDQPEFTVTDMPDPHEIREAISRAQDRQADQSN
jgi:uncharacterized membrane protein YdbT with pleckstrin-like domain